MSLLNIISLTSAIVVCVIRACVWCIIHLCRKIICRACICWQFQMSFSADFCFRQHQTAFICIILSSYSLMLHKKWKLLWTVKTKAIAVHDQGIYQRI